MFLIAMLFVDSAIGRGVAYGSTIVVVTVGAMQNR